MPSWVSVMVICILETDDLISAVVVMWLSDITHHSLTHYGNQ